MTKASYPKYINNSHKTVRRDSQSANNWATDLNRHLIREKNQMASTNMEVLSAVLVIREIKSKAQYTHQNG